jgi:putative SOS response-associated peptidase YedK
MRPSGRRTGPLVKQRYIWTMCGRFTHKLTWEELMRLYRLTLDQPARNTQARYNVCPTDPVDTVIERDGKRELVSMRWGLVPRWWSKSLKDVKMASVHSRELRNAFMSLDLERNAAVLTGPQPDPKPGTKIISKDALS